MHQFRAGGPGASGSPPRPFTSILAPEVMVMRKLTPARRLSSAGIASRGRGPEAADHSGPVNVARRTEGGGRKTEVSVASLAVALDWDDPSPTNITPDYFDLLAPLTGVRS